MKYTPTQIRSIVDLPEQTFRHWRKVLPPLQQRNGYRPCFTAGDALALMIIKTLSGGFGIGVGGLVPYATPLFHLCRGSNWPNLEKTYLLVQTENHTLSTLPMGDFLILDKPTLIVPLPQMLTKLRNKLMPVHQSEQQPLYFPPLPLSQRDTG